MNRTSAEKWLTLAFLSTCGVILIGLTIKLVAFAGQTEKPDRYASLSASYIDSGKWVLRKDQPLTAGDLKITYRGLVDGQILLDVTLIEMDPQYAYHRAIPEGVAAQDLKLGRRVFKVAAVRTLYLKLVPLPGNA